MIATNMTFGTPNDDVIAFSDKRYYKHTCDAMSADISSCYDVCEQKGATIPAEKTSGNLSVCINTIESKKTEQSKTVTPTKDGTIVYPDEGYALSSVTVNGDQNLIASNIIAGKSIFGVSGSAVVPWGNIEICTTNSTDVTNYATAQVVDSNLIASNIRENVNVLGVTGTMKEGIVPSGCIVITSNGNYNVTNYVGVNVNVSSSADIYPSTGFIVINGFRSSNGYFFGTAVIQVYKENGMIKVHPCSYNYGSGITFYCHSENYYYQGSLPSARMTFYQDASIDYPGCVISLIKTVQHDACGEFVLESVNVAAYAIV